MSFRVFISVCEFDTLFYMYLANVACFIRKVNFYMYNALSCALCYNNIIVICDVVVYMILVSALVLECISSQP